MTSLPYLRFTTDVYIHIVLGETIHFRRPSKESSTVAIINPALRRSKGNGRGFTVRFILTVRDRTDGFLPS